MATLILGEGEANIFIAHKVV